MTPNDDLEVRVSVRYAAPGRLFCRDCALPLSPLDLGAAATDERAWFCAVCAGDAIVVLPAG